jgi:hypothetical protein
MTAKLLNRKDFSDARDVRIPPPALSVALLVGSVCWLVGVVACYEATGFKDGWSQTPLLWLLTLMVTPSVCFALGVILVNARQQSRLSWFDGWALVVAFFPVTFGSFLSVLAVKAIFWASFREASIGLRIFGTSTCVALVIITSMIISRLGNQWR